MPISAELTCNLLLHIVSNINLVGIKSEITHIAISWAEAWHKADTCTHAHSVILFLLMGTFGVSQVRMSLGWWSKRRAVMKWRGSSSVHSGEQMVS